MFSKCIKKHYLIMEAMIILSLAESSVHSRYVYITKFIFLESLEIFYKINHFYKSTL